MPTVNPCVSLPLTGASVGMPFPVIPKPVAGGWTVSVTLKSDSTLRGSPPPATIYVMQNGRTLASLPITPTTSFVTYDVPVSDADLDKGTDGVCQVAGVVVLVVEDGSTGCCRPGNLPSTLNVHFACPGCGASPVGCPCWSDFDATITKPEDGDAWVGTIEIPGCASAYQVSFWCDNVSQWNFKVYDCQTNWGGARASQPGDCDPLDMDWTIGISTACCINPSGSSYSVTATITA